MTCGRSPPQASHRWRPGGFERFPGLFCLGVGQQLRAEHRSALRRDNHQQEQMLKLLPLTAAECASSTSETTSENQRKSKIPHPATGGQTARIPGITRVSIPVHSNRHTEPTATAQHSYSTEVTSK